MPRLARLLLAAAAASFAAVLLHDIFDVSVVWRAPWEKAYNATEFFAASACAVRARRSTGPERTAWLAMTIGLFAFFLGDVYWTVALEPLDSPPFPSFSDAGYLGIYPGFYIGLVLLLRARAGRISPALWLDGLITALSVAAVGAALVFGVVASSTEGSFAAVATNLGYPLGDLALLAFAFAVITVTGLRAGRTWLLIAAGFAVFAVADTTYLYQLAKDTYDEFQPLDIGWPAACLLVAVAAWQPARPLDARAVLRGWPMLVLPATATLTALALLVIDHYARINEAAVWLATGTLLVGVARFMLTFRANLRMLRRSEREATTDALTGLGNRRALLLDLDGRTADAETHVLALYDLDGFKSYNDAFGHLAGDALLERLGANIAAATVGKGTAYRMGGDEFCLLARVAPGADPEDVVRTGAGALSEQGGRFRIGCSYGMVVLDGRASDPIEALRLADQRMYANKRGGRRSSEETVHQVLLSVVGEHDGALRDHVDDVARLAERVGRRLGLGDADVAHVRRAAALHDIGKVAIPDAILHAPRPLTPEEWEYMRQHTVIGARIIAAAPELLPVADMVRSSHERWDGGGYPDRLAAGDIPLGARIVAVCDSFDAMTTDRAYRSAMRGADALAELERCAGTQFDPQVVAAFRAVLEGDAADVAVGHAVGAV
jgi:two-component system, cell cycle response regulator